MDTPPKTLPSVATSGTVSTVGAVPAVGTNLNKVTSAEGAQAAVTPTMLPAQTALLAAQAGLVPPPMPPSFMGIGMPVQFPSAGFGVPQVVGVRAPLQNGPGPLLIAGSGIPTIPYQQQIGAVSVTRGLSLSGAPAPFGSHQNQMTLSGAVPGVTQGTNSTVLPGPGKLASTADEKEENLYSPSQCQSSPQSDNSAPSPEGSPELNLDNVTSPSLQSKASNLNGLQMNQSFLSNPPSSGVEKGTEKCIQDVPSTSAQKPDSASSTPVRDPETSTPAQAQQVSCSFHKFCNMSIQYSNLVITFSSIQN